MTKICSFFHRTKQADPLGEEQEALVAADLEDGVGNTRGETADSGGARRPEGALVAAVITAYFVSALGIYYLLIGKFYLPPEAGRADGGEAIAMAGCVLLAVAGPVLAGSLAVCCCCRSAHGGGSSTVSLLD